MLKLADSTLIIALADELKRDRPGRVDAFIRAHGPFELSPVTVAEFLEGEPDRARADRVLRRFPVCPPLTRQTAQQAALLQRRAAAAGKRLGENDAWQAALAFKQRLLVSNDQGFDGLPGVRRLPHPKA